MSIVIATCGMLAREDMATAVRELCNGQKVQIKVSGRGEGARFKCWGEEGERSIFCWRTE